MSSFASSVGSIFRLAAGMHARDRLFLPVLVGLGLSLFGLQWAGGATRAEFDGYPDEAAQFISGRAIWEYVRAAPHENPVSWAGQYYLHYPKVAIGHWPPAYHLAEAFWSLLFGSSRLSAMGLQWFLGLCALAGFYLLIRPLFPPAILLLLLLFAVATPAFQIGLEQTMAELACLLCAIIFMHAMMRMLRRPDQTALCLVIASLVAAALTKGTAVCLLPVPVAALALTRTKIRIASYWPVAIIVAAGVICAAWYLSTIRSFAYAGFTNRVPWPIPNLGHMAGWGLVAVALLGIRRDPLSLLSASILGSAVVVSYGVRAMNEPRHWIMVLPAILVLTGYALTRAPKAIAALLLLPAAALFPWLWYHQQPSGYRDLVAQLHLPQRMLISSARGPLGEGGWIAEVALAERYPASLVARASQVLARSGWNGDRYTLLAHTPEEVSKRLDQLAIDVVILDQPSAPGEPDHALLKSAVTGSGAWKVCGSSHQILAYCRTRPPAAPREPLALDVAGLHFVERVAP